MNWKLPFALLAMCSIGRMASHAAETPSSAAAEPANTAWMTEAKYGIFMHYQHRILLGLCARTKPQFPEPSQMTADQWNTFVDGFDAEGFAKQMAEARVGWVMFCIDDHYFAWSCAPNKTFSDYTGYAPGERGSRRDLLMDVANALNARGVKTIGYFAGLNGYLKDRKSYEGLKDDNNDKTPPSAESRKRRIAVLKEYCDRYKDKIAAWWFDGVERESYAEQPNDWTTITETVHAANPRAAIAFSWGANEQACLRKGVDSYTAGDTWSKQDLKRLTPKNKPAQGGMLWHGKIYCGNIYHGIGDGNQFSDDELIAWIKTCNSEGGVCTLDWPFDPKTGLIKDFGMEQMKKIAAAVRGPEGK